MFPSPAIRHMPDFPIHAPNLAMPSHELRCPCNSIHA
jgi:hypothetical protein